MAKKGKTSKSAIDILNAQLSEIEKKITGLMGNTYTMLTQLQAVKDALAQGSQAGTLFSFDSNPAALAQLQNEVAQLAADIDKALQQGTAAAWNAGQKSVNDTLARTFGNTKAGKKEIETLDKEATAALRQRSATAHGFYTEPQGGVTISDRVWKMTASVKTDLEVAIQNAAMEGKSAADLAGEIKQYLKHPEHLYRAVRVKDPDTGEWTGEYKMSQAAIDAQARGEFGRGVYKSAYANALRLARTELTQAYRRAEWETYQENPLITGYRIELSNHHTTKVQTKKGTKEKPLHDICDEMAGTEYPKTFMWTGWHPNCRCKMVPILINNNDFKERVKARHAGKLGEWQPEKQTTKMPAAFIEWVKDNPNKVNNPKTAPFFIRDNYKDGNVAKGLNDRIANLAAIVQQAKVVPPPPKPITDYDTEVDELRNAAYKYGLDLTAMELLRTEGENKKALRKEIDKQRKKWNKRESEWNDAYQEARNQLLGLMGLLVTYQKQENTREFWELRETIIPNRESQIEQENPAYNVDAKQATKALKNIITELIRLKTQYGDFFKKNSQIKLVEKGDPRPEAKAAADIRSLKNYKELEEYVKNNDICQKLELEKLSFEDAREICAIWAQYKTDWNVPAIGLLGTNDRLKKETLAHASGALMEINSKLFAKEKTEASKTKTYEENAGSYKNDLENNIKNNQEQIDKYIEILDKKPFPITTELKKQIRQLITQLNAENKKYEEILNQGHTRHNVFISKEDTLKNIVQHELGHTIQDKLIGRNNTKGKSLTTNLTDKQQAEMRSKLIGLFNKYKDNCGWLSVYGATSKEEFFAEGMVLYMAAGGAGMPPDVKEFYDELKTMAIK